MAGGAPARQGRIPRAAAYPAPVMIVLVVVGICVVFIGLPVGLVLLVLHLQKSDLTKAWEKGGHRHGGHLAQGNEHGGSRLLCL